MFWKKKGDSGDDKDKKLFEMPTETRGAFRVYPSKEEPVILKLEGGKNTVHATDISSGGISFDNKGYKLNTTLSVEMSIPQLTKPLIGKLKIVKIDDKDSCKCIIQGMTPEQDDLVHNYVLKRQKEEIIEKKKI